MKLSIILPVRNQTDKLLKNLKEKIIPFFDGQNILYDILIESDGSSKEEEEKLEDALKTMPLQVKHIPYENKFGKGYAIKKAILASNSDYVLFMDVDLSTDLSAFNEIKKDIGKYDCFIGSREAKGAKIVEKQPFIRRLTHWGCRTLIRYKFHLKGITDTQCGFKMFKTDIAKLMVKHQIIDTFAFDVEYIYFLSLNHFSIKEIPVIWKDDPDSSISPKLMNISWNFYSALRIIKKNKKNYLLTEEERMSLKTSH